MPALFGNILSGYLLRQYGTKIIYGLLIIFGSGQILFCAGIWQDSYLMMLCGRFINGFGGEPFLIALLSMIKLYVAEEDFVLVNSVCWIVSRIFYSMSYYVNPEIWIQTHSWNLI
jgi:MFS family permease